MQLKKLSPLAGLLLTALLSACGGGGDDAPPPPAAPIPPAITITNVALSSTSPAAYAENVLVFDGGVCGGGTGALTATWDYGDGTTPVVNPGTNPTHTYAEAKTGQNTVTVKCADTAGTAIQTNTLKLTIQSAAMKGFLGKSWTAYSSIETNTSPYPVAGMNTNGDIYGVWVRRNGLTSANNEVVTGTTTFSLPNWNVEPSPLATGADRSPYIDFNKYMLTTAIDIAVSPNGHAMAAWMAGTSVWYATKAPGGAWSAPQSIASSAGNTANKSIKVVVNDAGDGAIAYCKNLSYTQPPNPATPPPAPPVVVTRAYAFVTPYLAHSTGGARQISNQCDTVDTDLGATATLQRNRAFDIAIDGSSKIFAAGIQDATSGAPNSLYTSQKSAIALQINTGGTWAPVPLVFADEIDKSPESLSFSLSPNGTYRALAWNQVDVSTHSNVYFSMWNGTAWSTVASFTHDISPTTDYSRPLIAVNDSGDAVIAMRLTDTFNVQSVAVANYDASAVPPAWGKEKIIAPSAGYRALDIAIDNWGTALVTNVDESINYTKAGTFAKKPGTAQWSGFKTISSSAPDTVYYLGSIHYQTMRALPDGRAVLVTSVYDDRSINNRISSGYMLLK